VEDRLIDVNHAIAGAAMAKEWLFADEFIFAIRYHHEPTALDESSPINIPDVSRRFIAIAQVAEYFIQQHIGLGQTSEWLKLGGGSLRLLAMGQDDLDALAAGAIATISGESVNG
jgi:hypothetical protein